ncbi:MAG TPA: DUF5666 domain-containing protein [Terriglobales bacterium]|jgi:hypothetical protein
MKKLVSVTLLAFLCTIAFAHEGMEHVVGTVDSVSGNSISVKTTAGENKQVAVDNSTKISRGGVAASLSDVQVGDRIVIHAKSHDGTLHAAEIELGKAKPGKAAK